MKGRIYLLLLVTFIGFAAVIVRLFQIQVLEHGRYSDRAIKQASSSHRFERQRGTIYDRRGRELAISLRVRSLAANPLKFPTAESREKAARKIAPILGVDQDVIVAKLARSGEFSWIDRKLPDASADAIAALKIPGLFFQTEYKRSYPHDSIAAHVLGFVGMDDAGLEGVERSHNGDLRGPDVEGSFLIDAYGNPIPTGGVIRYPQFNGRSVYLTIDLTVQSSLEQAIGRQIEAFGAKSASGIVVDPATGEILALANYPTFDPNNLVASDPESRRNRAVTDAFEPGSTFKIFSGALALEKGLVKQGEIFVCRGSMVVGRHSVRCHEAHGTLDYRRALEVSCNVVAMTVAQRMERAAFYEGLAAFGFGRPTGIDLAGEAGGILRTIEHWSGLSNSMLSLGQEISVTALQLASATVAMANGGRLMAPHLISKIADADGRVTRAYAPEVKAYPVKPDVARLMSNILEGVVTRGTGKMAEVKPFRVAGKTGTAQISGSAGGYIGGRYNAVFVGWTPSEAPVLAMAIVVHDPDPSKGYYGGQVSAPIFGWVGTEVMQYFGIRPAMGRDTAGGHPTIRPVRKLAGKFRNGKIEVPDLKGLTLRETNEALASLPLSFKPTGSGIAVSQSPAPGTLVALDSRIDVSFMPPAGAETFIDFSP